MADFKKKLFYFFPVLFCFCFPFGFKVLSPILMAWMFVSFFNWDLVSIRKGLFNKNLWLALSFFALTLISAFLSKNHNEANFSIEIKLSFLLFPYLLFCFSWPLNILRRCLVAFVSGCFFACLYLIARAAIFAYNGHPEYFTYTMFSDFIHASYFAMYLVLAIAIIVLFYDKWFAVSKRILISSYFFISIFVAAIFLCASKLGLISFFICIPILVYHKWQHHFTLSKIALILGSVGLLLFFTGRFMPEAYQRLSILNSISFDNLDKTSSESTTVRLLIWEQALLLMKDNFWMGVGVGDANDMLYKAYEQNGLTGAFQHKLNAHNQYFQTFIGMGLVGFVILILLTFGQMVKGLLTKQFMLFYFSLLIILNFQVESMLQAVAGVLFFAFFFCLFNLVDEKQILSE